MQLDTSIALGVKPAQVLSPNELMTNAYTMQNAQQTNQLNRMKMDEYTRSLAEQEQFKNALANSQDESSIRNAFYKLGEKGVKGYQEYVKSKAEQEKLGAETKNLGYTGQKTQVDIQELKAKHGAQMLRDLSQNPSNANVTAHFEDIQNSSLYSPEEKQAAKARLDQVLQMPIEQRQAYLASQGASASDLKPHIQTQNLGGTAKVLSIPAFGGTPTTLSTDQMTATPGELLTEATSRRGQDITATTSRRGQDLANARDLERIAIEKGKNSPEYIAMKARQEEKGKEQGKFEMSAPQAISTAEQMLTKIDDLVGKLATVDAKTGKVTPGTAAHEGFKAAVGKSSIFPTMPGSKAADFESRLNEIKGGAFLQAYNTLRGGGSITEVEGEKATQAITRMSTAQSEKEFIDAARDFQAVIREGIRVSKEKMSKGASAPATTPAGATVSNWK